MNIKLLSLLLCLSLLSTRMVAQYSDESKNISEICIGYGTPSLVTMVEGVHSGEDGYSSRPINTYTGTFNVTYRVYLIRWLSFGIGVAYEHETGTMQQFVGNSSNGAVTTQQGAFKRNVFSVAPEIIFNYTNPTRRIVYIYGYISLGASLLNELDMYSQTYYNTFYTNGVNSLGNNLDAVVNKTELTTQLCPIGVSIGGKVRGFAELGFGYKGIFNAGVSVKL